jgi:hypothetical protein
LFEGAISRPHGKLHFDATGGCDFVNIRQNKNTSEVAAMAVNIRSFAIYRRWITKFALSLHR